MDRSRLGGFGTTLPEWELAQALAAWTVRPWRRYRGESIEDLVQELIFEGKDGLCELSAWWFPPDTGDDPAPVYAEAWRRFVAQHPNPRLEILGAWSNVEAEDATWLARICCIPEVGAGSVYLRMDEPDWPVAWEWPLRLGVLGQTGSSGRHAKLLHALTKVEFGNLWSVVDMAQPGAECELLLLPGDLRQGLASILDAPQRPRADCVLVLNGCQISDPRSLALKAALRQEARAPGVAVVSAGMAIDEFLSALVRELSHDAPLDLALFSAQSAVRRGHGPSPMALPDLLFSRTLAISSRVRLSAARVAHQFSPERTNLQLDRVGRSSVVPVDLATPRSPGPSLAAAQQRNSTMDRLTRTLRDRVELGSWTAEVGDATELVKAREEIVRSTGQHHRSARISPGAAGPTLPPQPVNEADTREVLAQVMDLAQKQFVTTLRRDTAYRLRIKIALPDSQGFVGAGDPFPPLPPSIAGHQLDITFVMLESVAEGSPAMPQQQQIFLPSNGESTTADFLFSTRGLQQRFRARLLVSYQNRIVQTLRLEGDFDSSTGETVYQFGVENLVQPGFQNLAYQAPFDAALIVNHSVAGRPGITMLAGSIVSFLEPAGMGEMLDMLKTTLTDDTALRKADSSLDSDSMTDLMYALMQHGRLLYDYVEAQLGSLDTSAGRIQIVEARPGAYFPVEFLYPMEVPPEKPPLCPHARNALVGEALHQECPHRDDPEHMCPMRFWGFRKQIERQPAGVVPTAAQPAEIAAPTPLNGKLDLFRSIQVARSSKVQAADFDLPSGLLRTLNETFETIGAPGNWKEWRGGVAEQSPSFLLLLSHSTEDKISHLPALEISKDVLSMAALEVSYVKGPAAQAPIVFLMGCSTADPKIGFLNFVERFKRKQAALVVGTLSTISAQRATRFLALALPMLKDPRNRGRTFGEVFLDVKRATLASGDGFAMSLVAYGDMGWQIGGDSNV